jgi:hypothetical protein
VWGCNRKPDDVVSSGCQLLWQPEVDWVLSRGVITVVMGGCCRLNWGVAWTLLFLQWVADEGGAISR